MVSPAGGQAGAPPTRIHASPERIGPSEAMAGCSPSQVSSPRRIRKSTRRTAGKHSNLHHLPMTVGRVSGAAFS